MSFATRERAAPFDMGRVLGGAFAMVGARWARLLLLAVLIGCLPEAALAWVNLRTVARTGPEYWVLFYGVALLQSFADLLLRGSTLAVVLAPADQRPTLAGAFGTALRAIPAMLPFWLLAVAPPLLLFWFRPSNPRLMILFGWSPTVLASLIATALVLLVGVFNPVVIAERRGFLGAVRRAASLMPGGRWKLFALYLGFTLTTWVVLLVVTIAGAVGFGVDPTHNRAWIVASSHIAAALERLLYPVWSAISAMAYRELSRMQGGLPPDEISDIFA